MFFDQNFSEAIYNLANQSSFFDGLAIFFAVIFPYLLTIGFLIAVGRIAKDWRRRAYLMGFTAMALIISYGLVSRIFHFFYPRLRPFDEFNFLPLFQPGGATAFPSNHATIFFTLAFVLIFFSRAKNQWLVAEGELFDVYRLSHFHYWFLLGAGLVVFARIFAGVHWVSDVVAGILIALFAVIITNRILPVTR